MFAPSKPKKLSATLRNHREHYPAKLQVVWTRPEKSGRIGVGARLLNPPTETALAVIGLVHKTLDDAVRNESVN